METLSSSANPRLKRVRTLLHQPKRRREEHAFVLEGVRLVDDALDAGAKPEFVLLRADHQAKALVDRLQSAHIPCFSVEPKLFNELSDTETSQGVIAVCAWPDLPTPAKPSFTLILDGVSDPGNVGTILRTAVAAGVDLVALATHSVDPYNPKVVRAGMGAHFRVPVRSMHWDQIKALNVPIWVADMNGVKTIYEAEWTMPLALVIGSEAHGLSSQAVEAMTDALHIPMAAGESLNAAVAASIILYEIYRRRLSIE